MSSSICSSNLTSGFIDLATYDEQEKYLYGGPDAVAYFVREIRKATWFTQVPVCLSSRSGQPGFGQQWSVSISRAGDYLLHTWLSVTVASVALAGVSNSGSSGDSDNGDKVLRWTRNLAHNMIQECAITFNDLVAARFDNYHLDFWSAFTVPAGKRDGYNKMIGNVEALNNPGASYEAGAVTLPAVNLNLPLPFFFSRDSGMALPTAALPYNEMRISFAFRNLSDLLTVDTFNGSSWSSTPASANNLTNGDQVLSNVNVWANYAIVSNDERKKMACAPRDILIEQVQTAPTQNLLSQNQQPQFDIRFSHSIKSLFWAARNKTVSSCWSVYSDANPIPAASGSVDSTRGANPLLNTSLIYENTQRLYQMPSEYFSLVNPWFHAPVIPSGEQIGYNMYSYSLDFFAIDPMGSTNYGKLTNVSIIPQATPSAFSDSLVQKYDFITTAVNNNIIRISGGALGRNGKPKTGSCRVSYHSTYTDKQCNNDVSCAA